MSWAVWVTGLPGSGKTSVAREMERLLSSKGIRTKVLGIDEVRKFLTPHPKYTIEEREIVYAALAYMAKLLTDEGVNVIIDATGNLRKYRDRARSIIPDFYEVYIRCPIEISMKREAARVTGDAPRDIYKKGMTGLSATVPGINVPYEEPLAPIVTVDTDKLSPREGAIKAVNALLAAAGGTHG